MSALAISGMMLLVANSKASVASEGAGGQKWEYCTLTKAAYTSSPRAGVYWISYFRASGVQVVDVEDNATTNAAMSKALARLGDEGWELVGSGPLEVRPGTKLDALYFKRPRP
jgi:hypothetical protein